MEWDGEREQAAADHAALELSALGPRIAALADVEWHSAAAILYRVLVEDLAADCDALRRRLSTYFPGDR